MLQGRGQAVSGGWEVIIDLITSVPASHVPLQSQGVEDEEGVFSDEHAGDDMDQNSTDRKWPEASLSIAFSCMELIVDDFLELIFSQTDTVKNVISCLSTFSAQVADVNISLTAVEMLWKVTDFIMTSAREKGDKTTTTVVLEVMLKQLLILAMDQRPEVMHPL